MSFKSREKKRRAKIAVSKARVEHRDTMAGRHYFTVVSRGEKSSMKGERSLGAPQESA
jgi:hypothetical protein